MPAVKRIALVLAALVALVAVVLALLARPLAPPGLDSHARPAMGYGEARRLVDSIRTGEGDAIAGGCRTLWLDHGVRTARVVVLLHGLTNCPAQCDSLARLAFATGANVLVPRLPHHGYADRMTEALAQTKAAELCAFTDRVLDAAAGLGDTVIVAGLSTGGVMAAWAAQERADVGRAVVIAPMIGWSGAPGPRLTAMLTRAGSVLPNAFVWWDDERKQDLPGPKHVYPRFATRAVAATMQVGAAALAGAARRPPACRSMVVVTVGGDEAADNGAAAALAGRWREHGTAEVRTYEFPAALRLNHDIVDPEQVGADPAITYPVLMEFIAP